MWRCQNREGITLTLSNNKLGSQLLWIDLELDLHVQFQTSRPDFSAQSTSSGMMNFFESFGCLLSYKEDRGWCETVKTQRRCVSDGSSNPPYQMPCFPVCRVSLSWQKLRIRSSVDSRRRQLRHHLHQVHIKPLVACLWRPRRSKGSCFEKTTRLICCSMKILSMWGRRSEPW